MVEVLKVSRRSNPNSVAGALAGVVRGAGLAEVQVVGAGALNQAIKAVAIARGYMGASGRDLTCRPEFADIEIDGQGRTAIRLVVEACGLGPLDSGSGVTDRTNADLGSGRASIPGAVAERIAAIAEP
jgi:stage V sporulation protein S